MSTSFGIAPKGYRLPDATRIGRVTLQVADLARSLAYYERVLGFRVLERSEDGRVDVHQRRGAERNVARVHGDVDERARRRHVPVQRLRRLQPGVPASRHR